MVEIVRQCAALRRQGCEVIVVTSGAIAAGRERLDYPDLPPTVAGKQMLAAVGPEPADARLGEPVRDLRHPRRPDAA